MSWEPGMPSTTLGWASLEGEELLRDADPGMGISQGVVLLWDQLSWDDFRLCLLLLWCKPGFAPSALSEGVLVAPGSFLPCGWAQIQIQGPFSWQGTALVGLGLDGVHWLALGWFWDGWVDGWRCCPSSLEHSCRTRLLLQSFPGFSILSPNLLLELFSPKAFPSHSPCWSPFPGVLVAWAGSAPAVAALLLSPGSHCGAGIRKSPQGQPAALSFLEIKDLCSPGLG